MNQKDYHKARLALLSALDQGDDNGCFLLGIMYENGIGLEKNRIKAIEMFERADKAGVDVAKIELKKLLNKKDK